MREKEKKDGQLVRPGLGALLRTPPALTDTSGMHCSSTLLIRDLARLPVRWKACFWKYYSTATVPALVTELLAPV